MNHERTVWPVGVGFLIACFLFAAIVVKVKWSVSVPAIDADRAAVAPGRSLKSAPPRPRP